MWFYVETWIIDLGILGLVAVVMGVGFAALRIFKGWDDEVRQIEAYENAHRFAELAEGRGDK